MLIRCKSILRLHVVTMHNVSEVFYDYTRQTAEVNQVDQQVNLYVNRELAHDTVALRNSKRYI